MAAPRVDRRLTAILAADVVGYSRLMGRDEQGTLDRLKAHRKELVEPLVAEHGGRVVKLMGDGILCEFPSAVHAVTCAVAIQRGMAEREKDVPEAERIRFRIGINVGDVVHEGGDILGDGVNVAARLEALAEPGGVCIARNVHNQVKDKLAFRFEPAGRHRVKNIAEPVEVWRVAPGEVAVRAAGRRSRRSRPVYAAAAALAFLLLLVAGAAGWWWYDLRGPDEAAHRHSPGSLRSRCCRSPTSAARRRSLLRRRDDGRPHHRPRQGPRPGGHRPQLRVRLQGAPRRRAGSRARARGPLRRRGQRPPGRCRVRINAQLVDAATGGHLWADRFDRPAADVFAVREQEDALWHQVFTAQPARRRVFEPSSKRRKRRPAPWPPVTG